jgi:hypothetical protein
VNTAPMVASIGIDRSVYKCTEMSPTSLLSTPRCVAWIAMPSLYMPRYVNLLLFLASSCGMADACGMSDNDRVSFWLHPAASRPLNQYERSPLPNFTGF